MLNAFEKETQASLKQLEEIRSNFMYFRLFDTTSFRRLSEEMYAIKQPCDYIAIYQGRLYMLECKSSKHKISYKFEYIKQHQVDSMFKAEMAGAKAYFLINDRSRPRDYKCYAIKPSTLKILMATHPKKSIKWDELSKEKVIQLARLKGSLWKLSTILL